jgi:hypothetical protein
MRTVSLGLASPRTVAPAVITAVLTRKSLRFIVIKLLLIVLPHGSSGYPAKRARLAHRNAEGEDIMPTEIADFRLLMTGLNLNNPPSAIDISHYTVHPCFLQ